MTEITGMPLTKRKLLGLNIVKPKATQLQPKWQAELVEQ